jgi:putative transposase
MRSDTPSSRGYRFQPEIINHGVWLYHRLFLSFRDVEDLLAQRGITVAYEANRLRCFKFGPEYARALERRQGRLGDTWHLDEVFVTIQGRRQYLWRAVDQDGDVIDILVQSRRNERAAERFFRKLLKGQNRSPWRLVTDKLRSYGAAHRNVMPSVILQRRAVREQSGGSLLPTDAPTRATDATVQVPWSGTTIRIGPWSHSESLPCRTSPVGGCPSSRVRDRAFIAGTRRRVPPGKSKGSHLAGIGWLDRR